MRRGFDGDGGANVRVNFRVDTATAARLEAARRPGERLGDVARRSMLAGLDASALEERLGQRFKALENLFMRLFEQVPAVSAGREGERPRAGDRVGETEPDNLAVLFARSMEAFGERAGHVG